jgi:dTDP-4-dehydrorhamnose reductase
MDIMRLYILGCGGMLGDEVYHQFLSKGHDIFATDINLSSTWLKKYQDIRNYYDLMNTASSFKPDIIINLAAITDLEEAEKDSISTIETNALGSAHCTTIANILDIPYVYISTAGIFDGKKDIYTENDLPIPLGWYAKTKYWGEQFAQQTPKHIILRCGWQSGGCEKDKKFIAKIMKQLKNGATELNIVKDKFGCPTYTVDFTKQIEKMIETKSYGVWNAVCKGDANRYDVAVELIHLLSLEDKIKINIVSSDFWKEEYFAPRPDCERLSTEKLSLYGLNVMRHWKECLKDYVTNNPEYFSLEPK